MQRAQENGQLDNASKSLVLFFSRITESLQIARVDAKIFFSCFDRFKVSCARLQDFLKKNKRKKETKIQNGI